MRPRAGLIRLGVERQRVVTPTDPPRAGLLNQKYAHCMAATVAEGASTGMNATWRQPIIG